jgi:putative transposase
MKQIVCARTSLTRGCCVLTDAGTAVVVAILGSGYSLRNCLNQVESVEFDQVSEIRLIRDGEVAVLVEPLRPLWDALGDKAKQDTLFKLEVVEEIATGYRYGHPEFKREGEPRHPFGEGFGASESQRCAAMAEILSVEGYYDRALTRRIHDGEIQSSAKSSSAIRNWVRAWRTRGLRGLIDGRSIRPAKGPNVVDARFRAVANDVVGGLDGDISTVAIQELKRRTLLRLRGDGITAVDLDLPQRATAAYLSDLKRQRGKTTRAQRSASLQAIAGAQHFPAMRPGQVVAIDATRADNLVYAPFSGRSCSVEILTAIDVATRVIVALRVVPLSADAIDVALMVYDICRPFSCVVRGTTIDDWRWVGLPEQLDGLPLTTAHRGVSSDLSTIQGEHRIPSVLPDALRSDRGSIFKAALNRAILRDLGIDVLPSRKKHPTDNPHVERWHETMQRALQQIGGYKGRNVSERGRFVAEEPLLTAQELQDHLRRFIALDYHRDVHEGIVLSSNRETSKARLCPLESWDVFIEATGRIDVPQIPGLIYQFLPVRWGVIQHDGVEFNNMTYDSEALTPYRDVPRGFFRAQDRAAPFHVDRHDLSRIWFRDPGSPDRVVPVEWRGAYRDDTPMTSSIIDAACRRIRARGGNDALKSGAAREQILEEIGELTAPPISREMKPKLNAAARRLEQSRRDHDEAQVAYRDEPQPHSISAFRDEAAFHREWPDLLQDG